MSIQSFTEFTPSIMPEDWWPHEVRVQVIYNHPQHPDSPLGLGCIIKDKNEFDVYIKSLMQSMWVAVDKNNWMYENRMKNPTLEEIQAILESD